jgi:hypothetical protein
MAAIDTRVTMTDVMASRGIERPNCAGLSPEFFMPELATDEPSHARDICSRCESRPECPVSLGQLTLAEALDSVTSN